MSKLRTRRMALVLGVAAIAAAGCGSSSSKTTTKPTASAPAASTPSTPATPSTPSTTTTTGGSVTLTTPVSSPAVKALLVKDLQGGSNKLSPTKAQALGSCIISQWQKHGIKVVGDIQKSKQVSHSVAVGCGIGVGVASQIYGIK